MKRPVNYFIAFQMLAALVLLGACNREPANDSPSTATAPTANPSASDAPVPGQPTAEASGESAMTGTIADMGGPEWKLDSYADGESVPADIRITLAVGGEQISGHSGCNRYMGSIKNGEAPGGISIGPLALTRMACPPPQDAAEKRYTKALQAATSFEVRDGRLIVTYQDGETRRQLLYSRA